MWFDADTGTDEQDNVDGFAGFIPDRFTAAFLAAILLIGLGGYLLVRVS